MARDKYHLQNKKRFGSRDVDRHVTKLFDGYTEPSKNGETCVRNCDGKLVGIYPANRKQLATGTQKSIIRMLVEAGMWLVLFGVVFDGTVVLLERVFGTNLYTAVLALL